jgi:hypothetical protein
MGTEVESTSDVRIFLLGPSTGVASVVGTIPAQPGQVIVIDWMNGWCQNPSAGAGYGTSVQMRIANSEAVDQCFGHDDGFGTAANVVRAVFRPYWGGVPMASAATPGALLPNTAAVVTIVIDGATTDGGSNSNTVGGSVGYHYEVA